MSAPTKQSGTNPIENAYQGTGVTQAVAFNAGPARMLLVECAMEGDGGGGQSMTSLTYGGQALTRYDETHAADWSRTEVWYLLEAGIAAAANTNLVVVNTNDQVTLEIYRYDAVDQDNPFRVVQKQNATSGTSSSLTVAGVTSDDIVRYTITIDATSHAPAPGADQTEEYERVGAGGGMQSAGGVQAGSAGGVMSVTWTGSAPFSHIAYAIRGVAFPINGVLDAFPGPSLGNWSVMDTGGAIFAIASGQIVGSNSAYSSMYYNAASYGPDCEAYITYNGGGTAYAAICARVQGVGGAGTWDGYSVSWDGSSVYINEVTNGAATALATYTQTIGSGDKVGIRCFGSRIQAWHNQGAGWVMLGEVVNTTWTGSGRLAVEIYDPQADEPMDDFGGGTLGGAGGTTYDKTGALVTSTRAFGADVSERAELGALVSTTRALGADASERAELGSVVASSRAFGADAIERAELGSLAASARAFGADVAERGELGSLVAATLTFGVDVAERAEWGSLVAAGALSGSSGSLPPVPWWHGRGTP